MTIPINTGILKRHFLAFGFIPGGLGLANQGAVVPLQVDQNGVVQVSAGQAGGNNVGVIPNSADTVSGADFGAVAAAFNYLWNGASWDRARKANVFVSVLATGAGNTIVWTPATGRFRLMAYTISIAGTLAATGVELVKLTDGAGGTVIAQHQATVVSATPSGDTQIGADLGQGFVSGADGNVLNVNLGTAMATGGVAVNAWGCLEP
jgi:hypothetical protein